MNRVQTQGEGKGRERNKEGEGLFLLIFLFILYLSPVLSFYHLSLCYQSFFAGTVDLDDGTDALWTHRIISSLLLQPKISGFHSLFIWLLISLLSFLFSCHAFRICYSSQPPSFLPLHPLPHLITFNLNQFHSFFSCPISQPFMLDYYSLSTLSPISFLAPRVLQLS